MYSTRLRRSLSKLSLTRPPLSPLTTSPDAQFSSPLTRPTEESAECYLKHTKTASGATLVSDPMAGTSARADSQPKIKLYTLIRTLRALRMHIIGVADLTVEMDAQYVCGMLANPDIQRSAAINRWIASSRPCNSLTSSLSTCLPRTIKGQIVFRDVSPFQVKTMTTATPKTRKEWVDDILLLGLWLDAWEERCSHPDGTAKVSLFRPPRV